MIHVGSKTFTQLSHQLSSTIFQRAHSHTRGILHNPLFFLLQMNKTSSLWIFVKVITTFVVSFRYFSRVPCHNAIKDALHFLLAVN